jgi:trigger factor
LGDLKTVDDLRQQLSRNLEEEAREKEEERQEIDLLQQLIAQSEFEELPELLVEGELDKILAELQGTIEQQNLKFEDYLVHLHKTVDDLRKELVPKAIERVKTVLAIRKIAAKDNVSVSEDEINQEIERLSALYKNEPDVLAKLKSEGGRRYLSHILLNKKVIAWLKERVSR